MAKRKTAIVVEKVRGRLVPVSAYDAEIIDAMPDRAQFDLVRCDSRSNPQNRLYWLMLHHVVKATGKWATAEHLHEALKLDLGYVTVRLNLLGQPYIATDSTAFDEMGPAEFKAYFDQAEARIAEVTGIDPAELLPPRTIKEEAA